MRTAFDGYLNAITDLEVSAIKFAPDDSDVQLTLQYRLSESWIDSVYTKLKPQKSSTGAPLATDHYRQRRRVANGQGRRGVLSVRGKKPRFINLSGRPPRLKMKKGDKGCVRVPVILMV